MALQINTTLTTEDGGSVDSGSYVIFSTIFPPRGLYFTVHIKIYRSIAALDSGKGEIQVVEIRDRSFSKELTLMEFGTLTPVVIHNHVKTYLEGFVGGGNVSVIL